MNVRYYSVTSSESPYLSRWEVWDELEIRRVFYMSSHMELVTTSRHGGTEFSVKGDPVPCYSLDEMVERGWLVPESRITIHPDGTYTWRAPVLADPRD